MRQGGGDDYWSPETKRMMREMFPPASAESTREFLGLHPSNLQEPIDASVLRSFFEGEEQQTSAVALKDPVMTTLDSSSEDQYDFDFPLLEEEEGLLMQVQEVVKRAKKEKICNQCEAKDLKKTFKCPVDFVSILCKKCFNKMRALSSGVVNAKKRKKALAQVDSVAAASSASSAEEAAPKAKRLAKDS